jgi:hypothetical protein
MPGFMLGIHVFLSCAAQDVDARITLEDGASRFCAGMTK